MKTLTTLFAALSCVACLAQTSIPQQVRAQLTLDRIGMQGVGSSEVAYGISAPPGRTLGDYYLDNKWNKGTIMLEGTETLIEGYPLKYDLKSQTVEISTKNGIKLLDTKKIASLVWIDSLLGVPRYFVNAGKFKEEEVPLTGLLQVIVDGKKPLIAKTTILVKKPDYVPALDVGSRDTKISKKQTYYLSDQGNLIKITGKKKLLPFFGENAREVDNFIKTNNIDLREEAGLKRTFEFYNGLAKG